MYLIYIKLVIITIKTQGEIDITSNSNKKKTTMSFYTLYNKQGLCD